jgi:hypothetical protein
VEKQNSPKKRLFSGTKITETGFTQKSENSETMSYADKEGGVSSQKSVVYKPSQMSFREYDKKVR